MTQPEVLLDAARQVAQPTVAEQCDLAVADPFEQVAVVRDDEQRAGPAVEEVLERGECLDVEVVGRLVEQQHVGLVHEQAGQLQPPSLAAGEVTHPGLLARPGEPEPLGELARRELLAAQPHHRAHVLDGLDDPPVGPRLELADLLRQHRQAHGHPDLALARRERHLAGQRPQQRRLAGAVDPDDAGSLPRGQAPGDVLEQHPVTELDAARRPGRRRPCRAGSSRTA